jgi:hypothetical protein
MGTVKARVSNPASKRTETQTELSPVVQAEPKNALRRPARPPSGTLNRPSILKRRKLPAALPQTIVGRRSSGQIKKTPASTLYVVPEETRSNLTAVAPDDPVDRPNSLQMSGDYWQICYENRSAIIDDSRGLRYIALLIQHTGENKGPLHASELVALARGAGNVLVELPSKDPVFDATAEHEITKRFEQIAFERNAACARGDYDRVAVLDAEVDEITAEFERLKGRGRKKAVFNTDGEKARKAVSKAIADTLAKLGSLPEMEPLAKHLTEGIRRGQWLSYNGNIEWKIDFSIT